LPPDFTGLTSILLSRSHEQGPKGVDQRLLLLGRRPRPVAPDGEHRHALEIEVRQDLALDQLQHLVLLAGLEIRILPHDLLDVAGRLRDQLVRRYDVRVHAAREQRARERAKKRCTSRPRYESECVRRTAA
jgi:hypothetical protein